MRIGLIAPPFYTVPPQGYGGVELHVAALERALRRLGHETVLFATADSAAAASQRKSVFDRAQSRRSGKTVPELAQILAAYAAMPEVDVIHDHTMAGPLLGPGLGDTPIVATMHDLISPETLAIYGAAAARGVALVSISHAQRAAAGAIPVVDVIHHGLDPEDYGSDANHDGYFLWMGRLSPEKGAAAAARAGRETGTAVRLAGRMVPLHRRYFDEEVAPFLGSSVEYLGEVGGVVKRELLAGAVALLNPIDYEEPFGLVMLEALLSGTPVIACARGAAVEIVDHGRTGLLVDDYAGLVRSIGMVGSLDRETCARNAAQRFSADLMARAYVRVYERCTEFRAT